MLVFIHINKTAGTTVSHILRSSYGLRHCQVEPWHGRWTGPPFKKHDLQRVRKFYPDLKSIAGHRIVGNVDLHDHDGEFRYFTFMRDPLKSCASRFQYAIQIKGQKGLVFDQWIQQDWTRNHQVKWIAGIADVNEAIRIIKEKNIFVGLAERFDESIILLKALLANDLNIDYRRVNVAPRNTIKEDLLTNERTRQMLIEAQEVDLELYRYVAEELYPKYQEEYGSSLQADVEHYRRTKTNHFNYWNLTLCRLKHYMLYQPLLKLDRRGIRLVKSDPKRASSTST